MGADLLNESRWMLNDNILPEVCIVQNNFARDTGSEWIRIRWLMQRNMEEDDDFLRHRRKLPLHIQEHK